MQLIPAVSVIVSRFRLALAGVAFILARSDFGKGRRRCVLMPQAMQLTRFGSMQDQRVSPWQRAPLPDCGNLARLTVVVHGGLAPALVKTEPPGQSFTAHLHIPRIRWFPS